MAESFHESAEAPADIKSRLAASYDLIAPKYNDWTEQHSSSRLDWLGKLFAHLKVPSTGSTDSAPLKILELGAGAGLPTSKTLLDHNYNVHVILNDLSQRQVQLARENLADYGERVQFMPGDMTALSFEKGSLDAVVAMYSLIHLPRDEQSAMLEKIKMWLRPGGLMLANFSEEKAEHIVNENWIQDGAWVYWSGWGAEETTKLAKEQGFEVIETKVVEEVADAKFLWILASREA